MARTIRNGRTGVSADYLQLRGIFELLEPRRLLTSVVGESFDPNEPAHRFGFNFDTDVGASLDLTDFRIENLTQNAGAAPSQFNWSAGTNNLRLVPQSYAAGTTYLKNGNYEVLLSGLGIYDINGNSLGTAESDHVGRFWFYNADFDRDRDVDDTDQAIFQANFGGTGKTFATGDATGNGSVDLSDYGIFRGHYGTSLPAIPSGPNQLIAGAATSNSITLTWTNPSWAYDGFRVWRGTDPFNLTLIADLPGPFSGGEESESISWTDNNGGAGLADGTRYWYRVRSYTNAAGNSETTNKVSAATVMPTPDDVWVTALEDGVVRIDWSATSTTHTGFRIEHSDDDGRTWAHAGDAGPLARSFEIGTLPDGNRYVFRVRAEQTVDSQLTHMSAWTVPTATITTLRRPSDLSALRTGPSAVDLGWTDNSTGEVGYRLERSIDGAAFAELVTLAADVTSYSDTSGLLGGHTYSYRVLATSAGTDGASAPSSTATFVAPTLTLSGATTGQEGHTITVLLDAEDYPVRKWFVNWGDGIEQVVAAATSGGVLEVSHTYVDDAAGGYVVSAYVEDAAGRHHANEHQIQVSDVSGELLVESLGSAVVGSAATLTLSYNGDPGNDRITGYSVDFGDDSSTTTFPGDALAATHEYAEAGHYVATVSATTDDGRTVTALQPVNVYVAGVVPSPALVSAGAYSPTSIQLVWTYGTDPLNFKVYVNDGTGWVPLGAPLTGDKRRAIMTGLTPGTTYQVAMTALDSRVYADGPESELSGIQTVTMPSAAQGGLQVNGTAYEGDGGIPKARFEFTGAQVPKVQMRRREMSLPGDAQPHQWVDVHATAFAETLTWSSGSGGWVSILEMGGMPWGETWEYEFRGLDSGNQPVTEPAVAYMEWPHKAGWTPGNVDDLSITATPVTGLTGTYNIQLSYESDDFTTPVADHFDVVVWQDGIQRVVGLSSNQFTYTVKSTSSVAVKVGVRPQVGTMGVGGWETASVTVDGVTPPSPAAVSPYAPGPLVARPHSSSPTEHEIMLAWGDNSHNESGFAVERATDGAFTQNWVSFPVNKDEPTFTDTLVTPGLIYFYRVHAIGEGTADPSGYSEVVSASVVLPVIGVAADPSVASERRGDPGQFVVTRSGGYPFSLSVPLVEPTNTSLTLASGSDYQLVPGNADFLPGHAISYVRVDATADGVSPEPDEHVVRDLAVGGSYTVGEAWRGDVVIRGDNGGVAGDELPEVRVVAVEDGWESLGGGPRPVKFRLERVGTASQLDQSLQVVLAFGGTATPGVDYTRINPDGDYDYVTIPAGAAYLDLQFPVIPDLLVEGDETLLVRVVPQAGTYTTRSKGEAVGLIHDRPVLTIAAEPPGKVFESATENAKLIVTASVPMPRGYRVDYAVGGTATPGEDYGELPGFFVLPAGQTSYEIEVDPIDDEDVEPTESVAVTLAEGADYAVGSPDGDDVQIKDDEVDVDVDSKNDSNFEVPDAGNHPPEEDQVEEDAERPGKVIFVNDDDTDHDGVVDYADWNIGAGEKFVPLTLRIPEGLNVPGTKVKLVYAGSNPNDPALPDVLPNGSLRLWTVSGDSQRSPAAHYLPPNQEIDVALLFPNGALELHLWAEAVRPSTALANVEIEFTVMPPPELNVKVVPDRVRLTAVGPVNSTQNTGDAGAADGTPWTGNLNVQGLPEVTLRSSIQNANAVPGRQRVGFAIPGAPPQGTTAFVIADANLPTSTGALELDATSQPQYATNANRPAVVLNAIGGTAIVLTANESGVHGMAIVNATGPAITLDGSAGSVIAHNYLGVLSDGTTAAGNAVGVLVTASGQVTVRDNVISGNAGSGVVLRQAGTTEAKVYGNRIGTDWAGVEARPNHRYGVRVEDGASNNRIGSDVDGQGDMTESNVIAYNGTALGRKGHGVSIASGSRNRLRLNSIFENEGRGIDLGDDSFTLNDPPYLGDSDTGANELQNYPSVSAIDIENGVTTITWYISGNDQYDIDYYANSELDASGFGEGRQYLGSRRITPLDGELSWSFEVPPDTKRISAVATDSQGNTSEFSMIDADADGLADAWEGPEVGRGVDIDEDGAPDWRLPGASPNRKDIYVEVDAMDTRRPDPATLTAVEQAFAQAPAASVDNPDGSAGIKLHAELDSEIVPLQQWVDDEDAWPEFRALKAMHFGTLPEREDPNAAAILAAKRLTHRYAMFADVKGAEESSGAGELGGNDLMITLGAWNTPGGTPVQQQGTFMHELGHTLGLNHGGREETTSNYPNYHSVMNYLWQVPHSNGHTGWRLDYSREQLPTLNEAALEEAIGIGGDPASTVILGPKGTEWLTPPAAWVVPESGAVDWSKSGIYEVWPVQADINLDGDITDVFEGHDDWSAIRLPFRNAFAGEGHT